MSDDYELSLGECQSPPAAKLRVEIARRAQGEGPHVQRRIAELEAAVERVAGERDEARTGLEAYKAVCKQRNELLDEVKAERDEARAEVERLRDEIAHLRGLSPGPKPKLSRGEVAQIRARRFAGEGVRSLARAFDVSPAHVSNICNGKARTALVDADRYRAEVERLRTELATAQRHLTRAIDYIMTTPLGRHRDRKIVEGWVRTGEPESDDE